MLSLSQAPYKTTELYSSFKYLLVQITKVKILFSINLLQEKKNL